MKKKICLALMAVLLVLSIFTGFITVATAEEISIQFGIDSYYYLEGRNMTVSGLVLNGGSGATVTLTISNATGVIQTNNTVTDAYETFSHSLPVPSSGEYNITATSPGVTSGLLNFVVIGPNDIYEIQAEFTSEVIPVSLSNASNSGITSDLNTTGMVGGNETINATPYYFLVAKAAGETAYSIAYVDDDSAINFTSVDTNMTPIANLEVGSKVKLGNISRKIIYIDPLGSELILASPVAPLFSGDAVSKEVTALALNASGSPVSGEGITIEIIKDDGTVLQSSTSMGDTDDYGLVTKQISLPDTSGIYHIIFNNIGHISFSVENYELRGYVLSSELEPQHTFAADGNMVLAAVLSNASTDQPISDATVRAVVSGPGGSGELSLVYDKDIGMWKKAVSISTLFSSTGDYKVVYVATLASGEQQKAFTGFEIRGYDLFLKPVSPERPELEGFSPGEDGYIFVAGANLSSGDMADIAGLTGNANKTNFTLEILSGNGTDVTGTSWDVMNLSEFFLVGLGVPPWIQDEIKRHAGEGACVINFTAPGETGVYKVKVTVNLSGTIEEARTSIGVQKIFVHGEPVTSDGMFSPVVSRRENVTLRIMAFDPAQGTELPANNITDAGLIEVFSEGAGDIVTEYMENPTFVDGVDYDTLKFYVNDTELGFHHVKFWVNATVGGSSTMAVGEGWFETRQFFIWANPEGEGGVFKAFGSNSQINLTVHVKDGSFNPVERATASIDEIRYGKNWEKILFNSSSSTSGSTDANGTCTLRVEPSGSLRSGWYDVRIKVSAQDNAGEYITDYGRGWFEVRNFIFDVYPENWDVQANQPINFTVRVMDAADMTALKSATITLKKIIYMGSWENPQPPMVVETQGTWQTNTTNITTSATFRYTGDKVTSSGGYEFVFEAASGDNKEERRTWIECRPFIAWAYPADDNWDRRYGIGDNMNITVKGMKGWGGAAHNITTATNITKIMKEGWRMDRPYMTQVGIADNITVTQGETDAIVNITLNLTGWAQGAYFATIKVVDNGTPAAAEVYTNFWFQVELASVSIPEFYHIGIPEGNVYTNKVSFNVTQSSDQVFENPIEWPSYNYSVASNSYVEHHIIFIKDCWWTGGDDVECHRLSADQYPEPFWALVNRTSPQTLYVNYTDANFSHANTTQYQEGGMFNESCGRKWNITHIGSDGVVELEGLNALSTGYKVNTSLSLSGEFIMCDWMHDEKWLKVNLDGNESWDDRYYVLLADNKTEGTYDTVFVSNTTDFINDSINATSGAPVGFGGSPIYLINMQYENGRYVLGFTSYRSGWGGMWLGTFQKGTTIKIPFLVTTPGGVPIENANVTIDELTWHGPTSGIPISGVNKTTDENGLAMLELNTTEHKIPRGQHLIHYNVTLTESYDNAYISPEEKWNLPGLEIRNFVVNAEIGLPGEITLKEVSENASNMVIYNGEEIEAYGGFGGHYDTGYPDPKVSRIDWPFDNVFYNATNNTFHNMEGVELVNPMNNDSVNLTRDGMNITYNFTHRYPMGYNITITGIDSNATFCDYWNITVTDFGTDGEEDYVNLSVSYTPHPWSVENPETHSMMYAGKMIHGAGMSNFNVSYVNNDGEGNVTIELIDDRWIAHIKDLAELMDEDTSNGELSDTMITVADVPGTNVRLYAYNNVSMTSQEEMWDCSPTFDRIIAVNKSTHINKTYLIGQNISELGNNYTAMAPRWGGRIITVNGSSIDAPLYPLSDWAPDGDKYYMGKFTEEDVRCDVNKDENGKINATQSYYIMLRDQNPNGKYWPDEGRYDDDTDFTDVWSEMPLDMYGDEQGYSSMMEPGGKNFSERWLDMGSVYGWPFAAPSLKIDSTNKTATLTTLKQEEFFSTEENVTIWVEARKFDGTAVTGNISVDKLVVLWKESMGVEGEKFGPPLEYDIDVNSTLTNGEGTLIITNTTLQSEEVGDSFDFGEFLVMLNVTESGGGSETTERHFMMFNPEFMSGKEGEMP
ncbi:MAG: hypothetical protein WBD09_11530 [Halobacteriota archaeon]